MDTTSNLFHVARRRDHSFSFRLTLNEYQAINYGASYSG
jgi:hypothetical protein